MSHHFTQPADAHPDGLDLLMLLERYFSELGFYVVPLAPRSKRPVASDWPALRLTPDDHADHFGEVSRNVGLLLGPASGIVDIDLDCPEAVALAPHFLPSTRTFGRASSPRSHYLYRVRERTTSRRYEAGHTTLLEYRDSSEKSTPLQTMIPPSVHPSGERVLFDDETDIREIDAAELHARTARLAAASVLTKLWPRTPGVRHRAALALATVLAKAGFSVEEAEMFVAKVAVVAGDEEIDDRIAAVAPTIDKVEKGEATTGVPTLKELICTDLDDERALTKAVEWLGLDSTDSTDSSFAEKNHEQDGGGAKTQAARLIDLADAAGLDLWHDAENVAFATFEVNGHRETHRLDQRSFSRWLTRTYYEAEGSPLNDRVLTEAMQLFEARAVFDGEERRTAVRVAEARTPSGFAVYLDLCNTSWEVVEIAASGWRIVEGSGCPVRFVRASSMLALPTPERGGSVDDLWALLNLEEDSPDRTLLLGWLVQALRGTGPYPVLALTGEQGSGKSTAARVIRSLVDPNKAPLRSLPKNEQEAFISAVSSHVLTFDNVSGISDWQSDVMCRLSTGGGYATRRLYTTAEEYIFETQRPQIINGITDVIGRPDLAERTLPITLQRISEDARKTEAELVAYAEEVRPRLLGALLDAVTVGIARLGDVQLDRLPRLADFAVWATACEPGLGLEGGAFMEAFECGRRALVEATLEGDSVGEAVRLLVEREHGFVGTATSLLEKLADVMQLKDRHKPVDWPGNAAALSKHLKRIAPTLRSIDIDVDWARPNGQRQIVIQRIDID